MSVQDAHAFARPDWLLNLEAWAARLSPADLARVVDVLALELRRRDIGDHDTGQGRRGHATSADGARGGNGRRIHRRPATPTQRPVIRARCTEDG
jgi:hypothetical protein